MSETEFSKAKPFCLCVLAQLLESTRTLNLDFSHGLAQANVLPRPYTWQQALQLLPSINRPKSTCRVLTKVTKLTPPHPNPPQPLLRQPWQRFLLPKPATQPRKSLTTDTASPRTAQTITYIPPSPTHPRRGLGEKCSLSSKHRMRTQDPFPVLKNHSSVGQLNCRVNTLL